MKIMHVQRKPMTRYSRKLVLFLNYLFKLIAVSIFLEKVQIVGRRRLQRADDAVALWELLNCGVGVRGCSVCVCCLRALPLHPPGGLNTHLWGCIRCVPSPVFCLRWADEYTGRCFRLRVGGFGGGLRRGSTRHVPCGFFRDATSRICWCNWTCGVNSTSAGAQTHYILSVNCVRLSVCVCVCNLVPRAHFNSVSISSCTWGSWWRSGTRATLPTQHQKLLMSYCCTLLWNIIALCCVNKAGACCHSICSPAGQTSTREGVGEGGEI